MNLATAAHKSVLESLLLDDREERVRYVAGMTYGASKGLRELAAAIAEIDEVMGKDEQSAREKLNAAFVKTRELHLLLHANLMSFVRYAERNGPVKVTAEERP